MPRSRIALLGASSLAAVVLALASRRVAREPGVDYWAAWAAARAVAEGRVGDPWSAAGRERMGRDASARVVRDDAPPRERRAARAVLAANRGTLPSAGTPFLFTVLGVLSTGDYETDERAFSLASLALYAAAVLWLCRQLGYAPAPSLVALSFLVGPFDPWLSGERVANVQAIQLAVVAALPAALAARRPRTGELAAGALFAAGVAFKPNLLPVALPVVVTLLLRRRFRSLLAAAFGAAAGAAASLAGSALYFGRASCWREWARTLPDLLRPTYDVVQGNYALPTALRELTGVDAAGPLLALGLGGLVAFEAATADRASCTAGDARLPRPEVVALAGLGGALLLLVARLAWLHYFVLATPLLLYVMRPAGGEAPAVASGAERLAAAAAVAGFLPLRAFGLGLPPLVRGLVLQGALFLIVALALRILARSRRTAPPRPPDPAQGA